MNRRDFLKSLSVLGAAFTIPFEALAVVSDTVIDGVWLEAINDPMTFYVNEWRTLSADAEPYAPSTRGTMLMIDPVASRDELISLARDEWDISNMVEEYMADYGEVDLNDEWDDWLAGADNDTVDYLIDQANQWVNGVPDSGDCERGDISGYSGRGQALRFFRNDFEYCDDFDIVIVEGDCPGSSYFAAELRMDLDEANAYAVEYGIPIRFAAQG